VVVVVAGAAVVVVQADINQELHQLLSKHIQSQSEQVAVAAVGQTPDLTVLTQMHLE
jgi:hypothetical protein